MNGQAPLVLIAEDDPISLKLMRDVLQAGGFRTVEVGNGAEAVELAATLSPDVVVMDIGLPGLDGVDATMLIRAAPATARVPIIAVTAYAMPGDEPRMRAAGCDAYLTKPLHFAEFVQLVRRLVSGRSAAAQERPASGNEK